MDKNTCEIRLAFELMYAEKVLSDSEFIALLDNLSDLITVLKNRHEGGKDDGRFDN